jgi:hypothetical protein
MIYIYILYTKSCGSNILYMYIYYLYTRYSYLFIYLFIYLFVCFFIYTHVCVCICLPAAPKYAWCYLVPPNYILLSSTFLSLLGNPQTIATNRPTRRLLVNQSTHFVSRSYWHRHGHKVEEPHRTVLCCWAWSSWNLISRVICGTVPSAISGSWGQFVFSHVWSWSFNLFRSLRMVFLNRWTKVTWHYRGSDSLVRWVGLQDDSLQCAFFHSYML